MSERATFKRIQKVACRCQIDREKSDEWSTFYTLRPDPACELCCGTGTRLKRMAYDRDPDCHDFMRILDESWLAPETTPAAE